MAQAIGDEYDMKRSSLEVRRQIALGSHLIPLCMMQELNPGH